MRLFWLTILVIALCGASSSCSSSRHRGLRGGSLSPATRPGKTTRQGLLPKATGIYYRPKPKPHVVVILDPIKEDQTEFQHVVSTPFGTVSVQFHDLHLTGLEGAPLSQNYYQIFVDAPTQVPVLLKVKFGPNFTVAHYDLFDVKVNGRPAKFQLDKKPPYLYGSMWLRGGKNTVGYGEA